MVFVGFFRWVGLAPGTQAIFVGASLFWAWVLGYMHDAMHLKHFWMMEDVRGLGSWFQSIRRRHDIHHLELSDDGRMVANYGICFFFVDRIVGTYSRGHRPFNQLGYQAAKQRYAFVFRASSPGSQR
jgi:sterol desaturase/sphingolipid hydroxylase (fatty acid hydroxylase superfamily)